jgi:AcrR family transcriptional regulator
MTENVESSHARASVPMRGGGTKRVLDAAADLLVRWGYHRVTVEDVARHAGIGKGTVYLHFRTKEALFLTVLLRSQHRRRLAGPGRPDGSPSPA